MSKHTPLLFAVGSTFLIAVCASSCGGDSGTSTPPGGPVVVGGGGGGDPVTVDANPANPKDDAGKDLGWAQAPVMDGVLGTANRDSIVLTVPQVNGAQDYRVVALPAGVSVEADSSGKENVRGTTITCAGYKLRAAPPGPRELLRQIEVTGLTGEARLAIEAIDTACPFPGLIGNKHADIPVQSNGDIPESEAVPFSIFTPEEVKAKYGSIIYNGHGPAAKLGGQADPVAPKVLARTTVRVKPLGNGAPPTKSFFDDFSANDPLKLVEYQPGEEKTIHQNSKWTFYSYGYDGENGYQVFIDRGQLHTVLADGGQDIMGSNVGFPRRTFQISDKDYLHITFEVASAATDRRYWWLSVCGADALGQTMGADGKLVSRIKQTPFFYDDEGINPSSAGWNCFQVFNRFGWPFAMPPDNTFPESEVRVMVNRTGNPLQPNVVNVSPAQAPDGFRPPSWFRQMDSAGKLVAPIMDDQQLVAPRTTLDFYLRKDRAVMYVNGQQRLCNDFAGAPLSMAEGVVGFGQVLYHSTAERQGLGMLKMTGMRYYMEDTPYVDYRAWDNVGVDEHVTPAKVDESVCYKHH